MEETREAKGEGVVVQTDGPTGKFMNQPLLSTAPHPKNFKSRVQIALCKISLNYCLLLHAFYEY